MKTFMVLCCVLLACGVAEAGTVVVSRFDSAANASHVGYTYRIAQTWNWATFSFVTTEVLILSGQLADTSTPGFNYIYAARLSGPAHVVGTGYTWKIRPGVLTTPGAWGAPSSSGTFTAIP